MQPVRRWVCKYLQRAKHGHVATGVSPFCSATKYHPNVIKPGMVEMHRTYGESVPTDDRRDCRERRLKRFAPIFRERIAALTCCAPEAEDLIDSFPALLVALVSNFATPEIRAHAFRTILDGRPLKEAATALALPLWLKKMPPEAFREPIIQLPNTAPFASKISNFIPQEVGSTPDWLEQVQLAEGACDSAFALWVAKHCDAVTPLRRRFLFLLLGSWAWHAQRPETVGHGLIERPWSSQMGLRRATEELGNWRRRIDLAALLDDGINRPWLETGTVDGYQFVALRTLDDFLAESRAMHNCLDQYADRLSTGLIRVFSIRRSERRIADVEIGPGPTPGARPAIVQLKGPHNKQASLDVWDATQKWLETQPLERLSRRPGPLRGDDVPCGHDVTCGNEDRVHNRCGLLGMAKFWRPYLDWLPAHLKVEFEHIVLDARRRPLGRNRPHQIVEAQTGRRLTLETPSPRP